MLPRSAVVIWDSWVTITILVATPEPVMVTVPVLETVPVLAEFAVTVIAPLFEPDAGVTSSQLASSAIFQVVF